MHCLRNYLIFCVGLGEKYQVKSNDGTKCQENSFVGVR